MHIRDIIDNNKISFSFEFFPPQNEKSSETLFQTISELVNLKPAYVSVTYGAGGSTRDQSGRRAGSGLQPVPQTPSQYHQYGKSAWSTVFQAHQ